MPHGSTRNVAFSAFESLQGVICVASFPICSRGPMFARVLHVLQEPWIMRTRQVRERASDVVGKTVPERTQLWHQQFVESLVNEVFPR